MPEPVYCVSCRTREVDPTHAPFCSERCRMLDLAAWADGRYRVPGESIVLDEEPSDDSDEG